MISSRKFNLLVVAQLISLFLTSHKIVAQGDFENVYTINPNPNCSITIKVKKSKIKCEDATITKRVRNKVSIENSASVEEELNYGRINKYLSWAFEVWTCEGEHKIIPISIDLSNFANEGINDLIDQTFEASEFKLVDGSVKNELIDLTPVIIQDPNLAPVSIIGPKYAYAGTQITLIAEGGKAIPGAKYVWTRNSCEGETILEESSNILKIDAPDSTTSYFVHISSGPNDNTTCVSKEIKILAYSKKPDKIIAPNYVCENETKQITLEVEGGNLGINLNGRKAEWVWRINDELGVIVKRGKKITIPQPLYNTTYFVSPEGSNKVDGITHTVYTQSPSNLDFAAIKGSVDNICQGKRIKLELVGASFGKGAMVYWQETNQFAFKKIVSNSLVLETNPIKSSTYGVYVKDQCTTTKELQTTISVTEHSILPEQIKIDSSKRGRFVKLFFDDKDPYNVTRLNNNSKWVWYLRAEFPKYDSQGFPINAKILNSSTNSISINANHPPKQIYLKAYGQCEINEFVSISVPRKLDKYLFLTLGTSSNDPNNISTRVYTLGSHRVYFRYKQSNNASLIENYKSTSYLGQGNLITNFPSYTNQYYYFTNEKAILRTSYSFGVFLNQNDIKVYIGAGYGSVEYYNAVEVSTYKSTAKPVKSWAKFESNSVSGAELETGIAIKIKPFLLMGGIGYIRGSETSKGYISADINIGFAF